MMQIISQVKAKASGLKWYFTGKPCKRGHIDKRLVSNFCCATCGKEKIAVYREKNKKYISSYNKKYHEENRDLVLARHKTWLDKNRQSQFEYHKKYTNEKRHLINHWIALRRSRKLRAVPSWFEEFDEFVWKEAARLVQLRNTITGIKWHADHIIPLAAKLASGLHVGTNCQVIPMKMNSFKKNKIIYTQPGEWLGDTERFKR